MPKKNAYKARHPPVTTLEKQLLQGIAHALQLVYHTARIPFFHSPGSGPRRYPRGYKHIPCWKDSLGTTVYPRIIGGVLRVRRRYFDLADPQLIENIRPHLPHIMRPAIRLYD